jgi:hypothetical protein
MPELKPHRLIHIDSNPLSGSSSQDLNTQPLHRYYRKSPIMADVSNPNPMNMKKPELSSEDKKTWYGKKYEEGWRWIEDTYLKYFGENRTSYGVKGKLTFPLSISPHHFHKH